LRERYDFDLLLLDEPVSGVNPDMVNVILEKIKKLKGFGKAIIAVEHNIEAVEEISDYIYFMDSGKIMAPGLPEEILNNQDVMGTYIGI
jgi:ABC-type branched-subunit amino acid transport system ATPase component